MSVALPKLLYDNRLNDATPVASTTAAGFDVLNLRDVRPYSFWKPTALPATVTVDCGSAKAADFAAVFGHDLFSRGCTLEVRGSTDNFGASNVLVDTYTPTDNSALVRTFASVSYRYWRFRITGSTMPTLAIGMIGAALDLPRRHQLGFDPTARAARAQSNRSVGGYPLGKVVAFEEWRQTVSIDIVTWAWIRATWLPAWKAWLRAEPFLYAWDATDHPLELYLAQMDGEFTTPSVAGQYCGLEFALTGIPG